MTEAEIAVIVQEARYATDCPVSGDFEAAVRDAIFAGYCAGQRDFQLQVRTSETLDAERYRFLRDGAAFEDCGPSVCSGCSDLFDYHWGEEVDEVVDEAMARWKAAGSPVSKKEPA